jgi:hypothetical protein
MSIWPDGYKRPVVEMAHRKQQILAFSLSNLFGLLATTGGVIELLPVGVGN